MKIKFDAAFKNRGDVAVIVVGAIVIAIPVFIFGSIRTGQCPLWVKSRHVQRTSRCPLCAKSGHAQRN